MAMSGLFHEGGVQGTSHCEHAR